MSKVVIGYWKARGYISPIKLMLEYLEIPYKQVEHDCDPAPYYSKTKWMKEKYDLLKGFDFPNSPYYEDGDVKMTHYLAIMEYLGNKHGLYPRDIGKAAMIREQMRDICECHINYVYFSEHRKKGIQPTIEEKRASRQDFISTVVPKLKDLAASYVSGQWFTGSELCYVDFLAYDILDYVRLVSPAVLPDHLKSFMKKIEDLPSVKKYLQSDRYSRFPIFADRSYIGRSENDWLDHA